MLGRFVPLPPTIWLLHWSILTCDFGATQLRQPVLIASELLIVCMVCSDACHGARCFASVSAISLVEAGHLKHLMLHSTTFAFCGHPGNLAASLPLDSSFGTYGTVLRKNRKNMEQKHEKSLKHMLQTIWLQKERTGLVNIEVHILASCRTLWQCTWTSLGPFWPADTRFD